MKKARGKRLQSKVVETKEELCKVPSTAVYLVFKGESGPDCSPAFESAWDDYDKAKVHAAKLEELISKQHMRGRPKGHICWHNAQEYGPFHSYRRSYIRFEPKKKGALPNTYDYGEYPGEVVYIQEVFLNSPQEFR